MATPDKLKILILDDEKQFTEELGDFFLNSAFESFQANTVEDGKQILKDREINILFLDLRLPGIDGLDVLKEVKQLYPQIEVIIVSAHADMDTVQKSIQLGAFDYLRKPFRYIDIQIILERVTKYMQMQQKLTELEKQVGELSKLMKTKTR
ncbi:MAG: response regulator [Bacteroidetes bacterium]|nr:response regulator [Bacteroidota bacterium]